MCFCRKKKRKGNWCLVSSDQKRTSPPTLAHPSEVFSRQKYSHVKWSNGKTYLIRDITQMLNILRLEQLLRLLSALDFVLADFFHQTARIRYGNPAFSGRVVSDLSMLKETKKRWPDRKRRNTSARKKIGVGKQKMPQKLSIKKLIIRAPLHYFLTPIIRFETRSELRTWLFHKYRV